MQSNYARLQDKDESRKQGGGSSSSPSSSSNYYQQPIAPNPNSRTQPQFYPEVQHFSSLPTAAAAPSTKTRSAPSTPTVTPSTPQTPPRAPGTPVDTPPAHPSQPPIQSPPLYQGRPAQQPRISHGTLPYSSYSQQGVSLYAGGQVLYAEDGLSIGVSGEADSFAEYSDDSLTNGHHPDMPGVGGIMNKGAWSDGIFDCFDACLICLYALFLPCYRWALTVHRLNLLRFYPALFLYGLPYIIFILMYVLIFTLYPSTSGTDSNPHPTIFLSFLYGVFLSTYIFLVLMTAMYRRKIRYLYNIDSNCCCDCCYHFWCGCCAIAQEARHVDRDFAILI